MQQGRGYTQLRVRVAPNADYKPLGNAPQAPKEVSLGSPDDVTLRLCAELTAAGFTQDTLETVAKCGPERVASNLALALKKSREAARSATPIRNLGGLVAYMIQHDVTGKDAQAQKVDAKGLTAQKVRKLAALLKNAFEAALQEASRHLRGTLGDDGLGELHDIMRVELNKLTVSQLDKQSWQGASYKAALNAILYGKRRHLFPEHLQSLSAWVGREELFGEYTEKERERIVAEANTLFQADG